MSDNRLKTLILRGSKYGAIIGGVMSVVVAFASGEIDSFWAALFVLGIGGFIVGAIGGGAYWIFFEVVIARVDIWGRRGGTGCFLGPIVNLPILLKFLYILFAAPAATLLGALAFSGGGKGASTFGAILGAVVGLAMVLASIWPHLQVVFRPASVPFPLSRVERAVAFLSSIAGIISMFLTVVSLVLAIAG